MIAYARRNWEPVVFAELLALTTGYVAVLGGFAYQIARAAGYTA